MMGARIRKVPVLKGEITRLLALIQCRFGVDYWEEVISFHAIGGWVADYVVGHISIGSGYGHSGAVRLGATAGTIGTADIFSQPGQGSNNINGPLSPELPRQSSTRPSRWQLPLAAAWRSGRTTRQAFGSMTE